MLIATRATDTWSVITDVHGAAGVSGWHQLVPGRTLRGAWEAVELAQLPPGGVSGRHRHTRTHELYFVLSGHGDYLADGAEHPLPAGWLAVRPRGGVHGLRNGGPDNLLWLVVEVPDPTVRLSSPRGGSMMHRKAGPIDLTRTGYLDLTPYGVDPLQAAGVEEIPSQRTRELTADTGELFGYLLDGAGTLTSGEQTIPVTAGTGITLTLGEHAQFAATMPTRMFWVRSTAPDGVL